ncbi:conserved hypothetical protein [Ricinus communis]|uniref:Uncharacterized protein n=1 Tax=Ricinus communis TaxID=3988 RepID=B9SZD8_RICCO|nr:conserved hypothetical protein [Ricinus communis]
MVVAGSGNGGKGRIYLHAMMCDTLRLLPPVPFKVKVSVESDILPGGHKVTRNVKIL